MGRCEPSPFHLYSPPQPFRSKGVAGSEVGEAGLHLSSMLSSCAMKPHSTDKKPNHFQNVSEQLPSAKLYQYKPCLLLPDVSTVMLCNIHLSEACV